MNNERVDWKFKWKLSRELNTENVECYIEGFCLDFIDKGQHEGSKQRTDAIWVLI